MVALKLGIKRFLLKGTNVGTDLIWITRLTGPWGRDVTQRWLLGPAVALSDFSAIFTLVVQFDLDLYISIRGCCSGTPVLDFESLLKALVPARGNIILASYVIC